MCIETDFSMYHEVSDFCETLTSKAAFEGVCNCACINVSEWFEDKTEPCHATGFLPQILFTNISGKRKKTKGSRVTVVLHRLMQSFRLKTYAYHVLNQVCNTIKFSKRVVKTAS